MRRTHLDVRLVRLERHASTPHWAEGEGLASLLASVKHDPSTAGDVDEARGEALDTPTPLRGLEGLLWAIRHGQPQEPTA